MNVKSRFLLLREGITVGYVVKSFAQNVLPTVSDSQTIVVIILHTKRTSRIANFSTRKNPKKKKAVRVCSSCYRAELEFQNSKDYQSKGISSSFQPRKDLGFEKEGS